MTLEEIRARLEARLTDDWHYAFKRTWLEYHARQALHALADLEYRLKEFDRAP